MSLQIVTPPTVEPVTLDEVKARLRLTSTADDATISQQITAAREYAEKVTRRSLNVKSYAYFLDRFPYPHEPLRVPVPPLLSVTAIKYYDETLTEQTLATAEYWVAGQQIPALICPTPGNIWPPTARVPGAVEIDFNAGYGSVDTQGNPNGPAIPQHICEGIRQLAIHLYEHPETVTAEGLKSIPNNFETFFGANRVYVF